MQEAAQEIKQTGRRCIEIYADVSKEDEVKQMVDRVVDELGGLDVVSLLSVSLPALRHRLDAYTLCRWSQTQELPS